MSSIAISLPALMPSLVVALIGWRVYRRVRRLIGRQPVRPNRLLLTAVFFPVVLAMASVAGLGDPRLLAGVVAGAALGVALGWLGLRLTRFERTADGAFYVPNAWLGVAISLLFIGRLVYRFGVLTLGTGHVDPSSFRSFGSSPLTLAIFAIVAGYYTTYAVGVLVWHRKALARDGTNGTPVG